MIANSKCTLYLFNGVGYDRFVVPHCHYQENKADNVLKSGMQNADSVTVYIPLDCLVITPDNTLYPAIDLFPGKLNMPNRPAQDMLVKGECDFVFDNTDQKSVSESMKRFRSSFDFHTIMSVDIKDYGSKSLRHIKISGK